MQLKTTWDASMHGSTQIAFRTEDHSTDGNAVSGGSYSASWNQNRLSLCNSEAVYNAARRRKLTASGSLSLSGDLQGTYPRQSHSI